MPKITKKKFTNDYVDTLTLPAGKRQCEWFETLNTHPGRSLIFAVSYAGTRSWSVLYYDKGKPRRRKLGDHTATFGATQARKAAHAFDVEGAIATAQSGAFKEVAERWFRRHVEENALRSAREIRRQLEKYVFPKWGSKPFLEIRRKEVNDLLDDIADNHGRSQADAVLATLRKLMRWQQSRDETYSSPIVPDMKRVKRDPKAKKRWLTDDEIRNVWEACEQLETFGAMVRLLLLTGQRREKVVTMRWADIDLQTGEWRIPREPREKGNPGTITLPPSALKIIEAQPKILDTPYVFFGRGKKGHFDSFSQRKAELDATLPADMPAWVLHDLRRTARKLMTRAKVPVDVAELALGHSIKGIQAIYDDPTEYRQEIDKALRKVAIEVAKILEPGAKIIPITG